MKLNQAGIDLVKQFEGCRLKAYPDPGTGGEPYTIGYGYTVGVEPGDVWTQEKADNKLLETLTNLATHLVSYIEVELTDNQFSACVSLVYNIGIGNFVGHSLLKFINSDNMEAAANEFVKWDRAAGKEMAGLLRRREAEAALFRS